MPGFLNQEVISDHLVFHNYFSLCHQFICFLFQVTLQPLQPESQPPRPPPTQQKQKQPPQPQTQLHLKQKVCAIIGSLIDDIKVREFNLCYLCCTQSPNANKCKHIL